MKSDRLIVLLEPEEKARIVALARARPTSVGDWSARLLRGWVTRRPCGMAGWLEQPQPGRRSRAC